MTKKTQAEINKVLKAGLPAMVAGELKIRLEQADKLEELNEDLHKDNASLCEALEDLRKQVKDYGDLEYFKSELKEKAITLDGREAKLVHRNNILELKEAHAAELVGMMKDNFNTVFRNTTVRTKALEMRSDTFSTLQMGTDNREHSMTHTTQIPHDVTSEVEES